jgi:hypothetical protein
MLMKKNLLLLSFLFSLSTLFAQPVNDDCSDLIDLGTAPICPATLDTFTNVGATASTISSNPAFEIPVCFNGGVVNRDVWFKFTVPNDGSLVDIQVNVTGVDGPNGTISQPQVAVYRGECLLDELQELACAAAPLNQNEITIDLEALTPGLEYFLRINDWTASASSNEGDFVICIDEFNPCFNLCDVETTSDSSEGKLYDSGGPDGDYQNNENCTFTICPSAFNQCIFIDVVEYTLENGFEDLNFYAGEDTNAPQIFSLTGTGTNFELQASSDCITIQFTSDGSVTNPGFFLEWSASSDTCTIPPIISCDEPISIPSLPYVAIDLSTCFAGNTVSNGPCNEFFLNGEDYIFTYDSPGDECIMIDITGSGQQTGVAIYNNCPNVATECVASAGGGFGQTDPTINAAFLETAGTYYIVVANANNCTGFDINVETVDCPIVLPPAENCEDALSINGCANAPSTIAVSQIASTNLDFQEGCWGGSGAAFFTWFIFQAQEDGSFGFLAANSADPNFSDIDINVWGPYTDEDLVCDGTLDDEPIRSTWSGTPGVTGLIDINPETGAVVTEVCEGAGGSKFVSTISVITGEWYVVLINDYGGNIVDGQIDMDFTFTDDGVLGAADDNFTVTADTSVCVGEPVQLLAEGGSLIQWMSNPALSCVNCPNPVATVTETTIFEVAIFGACSSDTLAVEISALGGPDIDFTVDITECSDTSIVEVTEIISDSLNMFTSFNWELTIDGMTYTSLDENPIFEFTEIGLATLTLIATNDSGCSSASTQEFTINPPIFVLALGPDQTLTCDTLSIALDASDDFVTYAWSTTEETSEITVTQPGVYSITVTDICGVTLTDEVTINQDINTTPPDLPANVDICEGESFMYDAGDDFITYEWSPIEGLSCTDCPNPTANPIVTTIYTLTVTNADACVATATSQITVNPTETSNVTLEVCDGSTATYNGIDLEIGTTTDFDFFTLNGCDSTVTVAVIGLPNFNSTVDLSACDGSTVDYNGTTLDAGTTMDFNFTATNGCDSIVTVNVASLPNFASTLSLSACTGQTVDYNETTLEVGSTMDFVFQATNSCDSTVTVTVSELLNFTSTVDLSACEGQTVDYNGMPLVTGSMTDFTFTATNGCDSVVTVNVFLLPVFTATLNLAACEGGTVAYEGSDLMPGTMTDFTFIASNGCDSIVTVVVATLPNITTAENIAICEGETTDIFGTPTSTAGVYEMTFTATNGCDSTHTIDLTVFDAFTLNLSSTNNDCAGGLEGTATANTVGGVAPYTYEWNTGAMGQTITNQSAGIYAVVVTDANGCSAAGSIEIEQPAVIETTTTQVNVGCENPGSASASAIGGTLPLTYAWSTGITAQSIDDILAGEYTVTVTDANNCIMTETVVITGAFGPEISIDIDAQPTSNDLMGGELSVNINGGTAPFNFTWNNGGNTGILNNLGSGLYNLTVTDANGCGAEASATLFVPGCIIGQIWDDENRDGCQMLGESGIIDIELELNGTDIFGNDVTLTATTNNNGTYKFETMPPGTFEISYVDLDADEYGVSPMDNCNNDNKDSDFSVNTESFFITLAEGACPNNLDGGLFDPCLNVLDAGTICCDQVLCGPGNVPAPILSLTPGTGAGGAIEYIWMRNTNGAPLGSAGWSPIMGTNSPDYSPGALHITTYFARCVRAVGCENWLESNIVEIVVEDDAVAEINGPILNCVGDMVTYTALENAPGTTYQWNFGGLATPSTASSQTVNVTWNYYTTANIILTVTNDGCTSTDNYYVAISNSSIICGSSIVAEMYGLNKEEVNGTDATEYSILTNPISHELTVTWDEMVEGMVDMKLLSVDGQQVASSIAEGTALRHQIETTDLRSGLYLLQVQDANGTRQVLKVFKR